MEGRGESHPCPRAWSAATAPRNVSLTAVTTWRRYCFLSRLLHAPKKPTRRLLMMGPPGRSSALIRRNTLSTRGWALCRRRSLPFPLWRVCRCTASYFTNVFFFFFFFFVPPTTFSRAQLKTTVFLVKRWRRCGNVGADGAELYPQPQGVVWRRGG